MRRFIPDIPRNVAMAAATLVVTVLLFVTSYLILGGARDEAIAQNGRLTTQIAQTRTQIGEVGQNHEYVVANMAQYEALLKSDRLIPHTRRSAVVELQRVAQSRGITKLQYGFAGVMATSAEAVKVQQASAAYRLSVERVSLEIGAPIDGAVYGFLADITETFPGAAVLESISLARPPAITEADLAGLSAPRGGALAQGTLVFSWRTAQANEAANAGAK